MKEYQMSSESQLKKRLRAITQARVQFRESVTDPLKRSMLARSPMASAAIVWDIPIDAAANGFTITTSQSHTLWTVVLEREIDDELEIETAGVARSLFKALWQLAEVTEGRIVEMEAECTREMNRIQRRARTAA